MSNVVPATWTPPTYKVRIFTRTKGGKLRDEGFWVLATRKSGQEGWKWLADQLYHLGIGGRFLDTLDLRYEYLEGNVVVGYDAGNEIRVILANGA